jgi:hypothetical protein
MSHRLTLFLATSLALLAACADPSKEDARYRGALPPDEVAARVNGVAITRAELGAATGAEGHPGLGGGDDEAKDLDRLVRQELAAQEAVRLGLDPGPAYRAELGRLEAQVQAFRRQRLADLYDREVGVKADVSDDEARRHWDANAARLRTEVHVWQIFLRHEGEIEAARRDLEAGVPFEEAARRRFPQVPASAGAFWDVGWVRLAQAPEPWREELSKLEPGATSGVLRGPKGRFWILKLVARREDPALTFEAVKPAVVEAVRAAKVEARRAETERRLRARAKVEIAPRATPGT